MPATNGPNTTYDAAVLPWRRQRRRRTDDHVVVAVAVDITSRRDNRGLLVARTRNFTNGTDIGSAAAGAASTHTAAATASPIATRMRQPYWWTLADTTVHRHASCVATPRQGGGTSRCCSRLEQKRDACPASTGLRDQAGHCGELARVGIVPVRVPPPRRRGAGACASSRCSGSGSASESPGLAIVVAALGGEPAVRFVDASENSCSQAQREPRARSPTGGGNVRRMFEHRRTLARFP